MPIIIGLGTRTLTSAVTAVIVGLITQHAAAQTIQGTAAYRERMAMPAGAVFEATLEDVSRADAPASVIHSQAVSPNAEGTKPLVGTYWKATELAGKPTPTQDANREAHLLFQPAGRVSGSDGCNRFTGSYTQMGDTVTFGQMAGTQMACIDTSAEIERAFREALKSATRLLVVNQRLDLFDTAGNRVAVFTAGAQAAWSLTAPQLTGTSWQLVKFQGGDEKTLTPDDGAKYTVEFSSGGRLTARIDCNRGSGTWKSNAANQLQFGSLALTRAQCPAQSMHDQIVKQWANIRSYVIKDGHLYLSLLADGGIYEFEPIKTSNR